MAVLQALGSALLLAFSMFWEVLWPLALGFLLSAAVQALVPKQAVARTLGRGGFSGVAYAAGFGAASSSCSYAAVAIARSLFRKGARLGNAILFEFASTNLVFELGLVLLTLLGWQFLTAEFAGGLLMIALLAVTFKYTLRRRLVEGARAQAEKGLRGRMEGHAEMDMSVGSGPFLSRLFSPGAFTALAHYFWMDVASLWQDLGLGFLIAGALGAWVPTHFWQAFFLTQDPGIARFWGPLIGPVIAMLSFVCSVGNVPLAAVLWNGGISFGGVIAFIFADLIILPIVNIHRRYYGWRVSLYLLGVSYGAMALAGFLIELLFGALGIVPHHFQVTVLTSHPSWNATTVLDLIALAVAGILAWRFLSTGGREMLRMMSADH
ncbi:MAG: permease [Candidatus Dormibacteraeota bacterium]|nr:permease [Candidatus Dormibacteraeota bacterium]